MEINKEIVKNIIYDTYLDFQKKFQDSDKAYEQTILALKNLLKNDTYNAFAKTDNIRQTLLSAFPYPEDCTETILNDFVDIMFKTYPQSTSQRTLFEAMEVTYNSHDKEQVIYALNTALKRGNFNGFSKFHNGNKNIDYRRRLLDFVSSEDILNIITSMVTNHIITEKEFQEISQNIGKQYANQINNFQINPAAFNKCKQDILQGKQITFQRQDYSLGNDLYASIDMGNKRKNQEDSVIILNHPQNPEFKMLVVADGMGGLAYGEKASYAITSQITNWFESLDPQYFASQNIGYLKQYFEQEIQNINKDLYNTYRGNSSSTFVGAIVADKETIISHVGDSRAYIYAQGKLHQLTEDDSLCYDLWKAGYIVQKDDIRFHKSSNQVRKGMGIDKYVIPTTSIISNSKYDTLLLFSDGITDCLSDTQIMAITSSTSPKDLAKTLVDTAKNNHSYQYHLDPNEYNTHIPGGKDNTTAAVYDKRSKNSREEGR